MFFFCGFGKKPLASRFSCGVRSRSFYTFKSTAPRSYEPENKARPTRKKNEQPIRIRRSLARAVDWFADSFLLKKWRLSLSNGKDFLTHLSRRTLLGRKKNEKEEREVTLECNKCLLAEKATSPTKEKNLLIKNFTCNTFLSPKKKKNHRRWRCTEKDFACKISDEKKIHSRKTRNCIFTGEMR